jgi:hypothetical protein
MWLLTSQVISKSWTRDSRFHFNDLCTGSLLVLCGVQFYPYFCLLFVLATPCKYFVFIKSLKLSNIPCCVWYSGLAEHSHASVCAWVPTENREYSIIVVLIITTNLLFVCHLFKFWFSADLICETSQATASTYWVSHVLLITYYVGVWGGHLTLFLAFTRQDYPQWSHSSTSAHKILPFISIWVVINIRLNSALLQGFMQWTCKRISWINN